MSSLKKVCGYKTLAASTHQDVNDLMDEYCEYEYEALGPVCVTCKPTTGEREYLATMVKYSDLWSIDVDDYAEDLGIDEYTEEPAEVLAFVLSHVLKQQMYLFTEASGSPLGPLSTLTGKNLEDALKLFRELPGETGV